MRVLFVTLGTNRVAASRYRVYQYLPYFESKGIRYKVFSIISDFLTRLAIKSPEFGEFTRFAYYLLVFIEKFFRFWIVFSIAPYFDLIFLQRVTFPFGFGGLLRLRNRLIVFDIDDAIFLPDSQKGDIITKLKTFIKERELVEILKIASCVIVENDYIKSYVSRYCSRVHKIPGPIDTERYFVKEIGGGPDGKEATVIGWIGSPATTSYLHLLDNVFAEILLEFKFVKIVLIGAGNYSYKSERVAKRTWSYETEVAQLQGFDIGIMPMPNDEWTKGKLGCKMLQYMAVGIPSVVSYTPTNAEMIRDGENGFLVMTERDWVDRISILIRERDLRMKIGRSGRETVEELCAVKKCSEALISILRDICC